MISNPCTWFSGGGGYEDQKSFTYQNPSGPIGVWHFSPHDNGFSTSMENNIVWFASSKEEALKILREMFEFSLECAYAQSKYYQGSEGRHHEEFHSRVKGSIDMYKEYVESLDKGTLKITKAPTNQFYKVGWASNDTLQ